MINWALILEIVGVVGGIATWIALCLAPMFYLGTKIESLRKEIQEDMKEFHKENKDFHARLCVIEERNKRGIQQ